MYFGLFLNPLEKLQICVKMQIKKNQKKKIKKTSFEQVIEVFDGVRKNCTNFPYNNKLNKYISVQMILRYMFAGHCTEYNRGGNLIQGNIQTYCKTFTKKPCPKVYPSTRAYNCKLLSVNE